MKLAMFDLSGKVAVITGGCSGLGITFSEALAETGADVVIADVLVGTPQCQDVGSSLEKFGVRVLPVKCDVTSPESVDNLVATTVREFGKIDILVNSAGISGDQKHLVDMSTENWDKVLAVDLKGTFLCCRSAAREMIKRKEGKIINIASVCSFKAISELGAYASAKSGLLMLTKTLALELIRYNIQVNSLNPGYFLTPLNREFFEETEAGKRVINSWPGKRIGNTDELKGVIIYLASLASSYTTGTSFLVDGGQSL